MAQKNFGWFVRWARGRMNWSDQLICFVEIGDNQKNSCHFFFFLSDGIFFPPPCLVIFRPEGRGIAPMVLLQNRNMRRRSAFFIIFLILFFFERDREREVKGIKNFFLLLLPSAAGRCASLSAVQLDVVCWAPIWKKKEKIGKKGATSFDWASHSFLWRSATSHLG